MWYETLGYRDYRPQYLPAFFDEAARRLGLSGREDMLDLGCGMGALLFAFAPHVGTLTGIDFELPSLDQVRKRAPGLGRPVRLVHARVEDAAEDLGPFDLITIGKAYWYMHSPATLARIDRWLRPGGRVLICSPTEQAAPDSIWQKTFFLVLDRWAIGNVDDSLRKLTPEAFFHGTAFAPVDRIDVRGEQTIDLEHLVNRGFGYPQTTPAGLGADAERLARDLRRIMGRFFRNGPIIEPLHTSGIIFQRRRDRAGR